jgi:hypothetical protein
LLYGNERRREWRTLGRRRVAPRHVTGGQEFNQTRTITIFPMAGPGRATGFAPPCPPRPPRKPIGGTDRLSEHQEPNARQSKGWLPHHAGLADGRMRRCVGCGWAEKSLGYSARGNRDAKQRGCSRGDPRSTSDWGFEHHVHCVARPSSHDPEHV